MTSQPVLRIENIRHTVQNGVHRVCADVDGALVWYESADVALQAAPEIFASAFLLPAMVIRSVLIVDAPLSSVWTANAQKLMEIFREWWGYPLIRIKAEIAEPQPECAGRTALFFTGGVDSFYSLLRGDCPVDDLIYVHGFDLSLEDEQRLAEVRAHLGAVAAAEGKRLLILKTNLRQHPLIQEVGWGHAHGGALAAVAHGLPEVSKVIISSSCSRMANIPWGSHWQSDPLWSSERLEILHFGDRVYRSDKLVDIASEPLVRQHLRVCWKNRSEHLNCCQCEKCVRAMLLLEISGKLDSYSIFPFRDDLPRSIRCVRYVMAGVIPSYEDFIQRGLPRKTERAVRALLRRSRFRLFRKSIEKVLNPWSRMDAG